MTSRKGEVVFGDLEGAGSTLVYGMSRKPWSLLAEGVP